MMKANSIIFTLVLVSGNCVGFAPGHQLYPHEKWGLDFDVLSSYSETTKSYDIVVLVEKKKELRKLQDLVLEVSDNEGELISASLNIRTYNEQLNIHGKAVKKFTGAKLTIKREYLERSVLWLEGPTFLHIAHLSDFVPAHADALIDGALIDRVLGIALPPQSSAWHTPERVRDELGRAFGAATLIVEGTVTNESARIPSASGKWIKGWPETYPVFNISLTTFWRGSSNETTIIVEHMGSGSSIDTSAFPDKGFLNGARYVFFLRPNDQVSKWSGRKIWRIIKGVPIRNAASRAPGEPLSDDAKSQ